VRASLWIALVLATCAASVRVSAAGLPGIGADDPRVPVDGRAPPWAAVARLQIPGIDRCTAFLLAPRLAVTAAHCLWAARLNRFAPAEAVHVLSGYASGAYAFHTTVASFRIGAGYDPKQPYATLGADVALLTLSGDLGGSSAPLVLASPEASPGAALALGGYSQDRAEILLADLQCRAVGIVRDPQGGLLIRHSCTGTHGTSGAPLLVRRPDGGWAVAGVQVAGLVAGSGGEAVPAATIRALLTEMAMAR
jgi:protease YdgD